MRLKSINNALGETLPAESIKSEHAIPARIIDAFQRPARARPGQFPHTMRREKKKAASSAALVVHLVGRLSG